MHSVLIVDDEEGLQTSLVKAVARRIAALHGGELLIESGRGQGTTARVRLPRSR